MINNSPLDEHVKKQFSHYKPEVPAHIWENIVAGKEKRKPVGFWNGFLNKNSLFLLLAVVITAGGIVIYQNVNEPGNTIATSTSSPANNATQTTTGTNSNKPLQNIQTENKLNIVPSTEPTVNNSTNNTQKIINDNNIVTDNANKKNSISTDTNGPADLAVNNNEPANKKIKKPRSFKGNASIIVKDPGAVEDGSIEELTGTGTNTVSNDVLLSRSLLNFEMMHSVAGNPSLKRINIPFLDIPCPGAEKNAAGNKRYVEIYGGPDYAIRNMTDTGNSEYLKRRKESASFTSAFSVGMRYTKVFGNGMSFRTGLNYSQINEKFKFAEGNVIQVVYITDSNGDTTGSYTTSGTRYKTTHNKYRTIDVPLLIGYELGNGRIHANINAGAIVNVYSWQKGDVLDTAFKPVNITTGKGSSPYQFKTNVGVGFLGAVSVYYKLNERLHILAEPYFRYNFSPASKSELTLKQKYNTAGLRLGLRLDF